MRDVQRIVSDLNSLRDLNQRREAMLNRLWALGNEFPDADIQTEFERVQQNTRDRIAVTAVKIDRLEMMYEEALQDAVG